MGQVFRIHSRRGSGRVAHPHMAGDRTNVRIVRRSAKRMKKPLSRANDSLYPSDRPRSGIGPDGLATKLVDGLTQTSGNFIDRFIPSNPLKSAASFLANSTLGKQQTVWVLRVFQIGRGFCTERSPCEWMIAIGPQLDRLAPFQLNDPRTSIGTIERTRTNDAPFRTFNRSICRCLIHAPTISKNDKNKSGINAKVGYIYAMSHKIAVAIYDGLSGFEYGIVAEIFGLKRPNLGVPWYDYLPCRVERGTLKTNHGLEIRPKYRIADLVEADTVMVPGWRPPFDPPRPAFLRALQTAHQKGARIISICTGVFALAYAGLLDGRRATTHWFYADRFRKTFPDVSLQESALYVRDGQVYSSAGSAAGLDLCLAIVREDFGVSVANTIARRMVAPSHREGGQSQYAEPTLLTLDDDEFGPILDWMDRNLDRPFSIEEIAKRFSLSLRTFQRRFQRLTGVPPNRWLNQKRVAKARGLLEATDLSIEQVAAQSGLGSAANLRKHFANALGTTPRTYRTTFRGKA